MDLLLTFIVLALANILFFYPVSENIVPALQIVLVVLLGFSFLLESFYVIRRRILKEEEKELLAREARDAATAAAPPSPDAAVEAAVVQFLARLQEKGRLVDFLMDDIGPYSDEQISAAARVVHQGCRDVLNGAFTIQPVHQGGEQEAISLSADFDAGAYRLVGKVPEQAPYRGTVLHRGWKTTRVNLPRVTEAAREASARAIIAPAEVEIGGRQ